MWRNGQCKGPVVQTMVWVFKASEAGAESRNKKGKDEVMFLSKCEVHLDDVDEL